MKRPIVLMLAGLTLLTSSSYAKKKTSYRVKLIGVLNNKEVPIKTLLGDNIKVEVTSVARKCSSSSSLLEPSYPERNHREYELDDTDSIVVENNYDKKCKFQNSQLVIKGMDFANSDLKIDLYKESHDAGIPMFTSNKSDQINLNCSYQIYDNYYNEPNRAFSNCNVVGDKSLSAGKNGDTKVIRVSTRNFLEKKVKFDHTIWDGNQKYHVPNAQKHFDKNGYVQISHKRDDSGDLVPHLWVDGELGKKLKKVEE